MQQFNEFFKRRHSFIYPALKRADVPVCAILNV